MTAAALLASTIIASQSPQQALQAPRILLQRGISVHVKALPGIAIGLHVCCEGYHAALASLCCKRQRPIPAIWLPASFSMACS